MNLNKATLPSSTLYNASGRDYPDLSELCGLVHPYCRSLNYGQLGGLVNLNCISVNYCQLGGVSVTAASAPVINVYCII